ncbi:hypothetical protein J6590_033243 [Homalodisca vitripennis]|nr:hypothetical protein J6590_033243 [Homalodisca vitripennis]
MLRTFHAVLESCGLEGLSDGVHTRLAGPLSVSGEFIVPSSRFGYLQDLRATWTSGYESGLWWNLDSLRTLI